MSVDILKLIDEIYACASEPANWDNAAVKIARALGAHAVALQYQHIDAPQCAMRAIRGFDPAWTADYLDHWDRINAWRIAGIARAYAKPERDRYAAMHASAMAPASKFRRTAVFNESLKRMDLYDSIGDDFLIGGLGDDSLNGGADHDTALFFGNSADYSYTVAKHANGFVTGFTSVTDNNPGDGDEGADSLSSIESIVALGDGEALDAAQPCNCSTPATLSSARSTRSRKPLTPPAMETRLHAGRRHRRRDPPLRIWSGRQQLRRSHRAGEPGRGRYRHRLRRRKLDHPRRRRRRNPPCGRFFVRVGGNPPIRS